MWWSETAGIKELTISWRDSSCLKTWWLQGTIWTPSPPIFTTQNPQQWCLTACLSTQSLSSTRLVSTKLFLSYGGKHTKKTKTPIFCSLANSPPSRTLERESKSLRLILIDFANSSSHSIKRSRRSTVRRLRAMLTKNFSFKFVWHFSSVFFSRWATSWASTITTLLPKPKKPLKLSWHLRQMYVKATSRSTWSKLSKTWTTASKRSRRQTWRAWRTTQSSKGYSLTSGML